MNLPYVILVPRRQSPETLKSPLELHGVPAAAGHALSNRAGGDLPTPFRLKSGLHALLILFALFLAPPSARAADANPPNKMSYQGYVVDTNGEPLGKDNPLNYDVIFRIYDHATAGSLLWTEQQTVTIDKGYFSVSLGEGSPVGNDIRPALSAVFSGQSASDRFIGITVKKLSTTDVEIMPRLRLMPAPYAFLATKATAVANASGANLINTSGANVGIGTAAPNYQLSLGNSVVNTKLALYDSGGTDTYGLGMGSSQFRLHLGGTSARFSFLNGPAGTEVMTIQGSGNVGIGTTTPGSSLQVNGGIRARGGDPGSNGAGNNGYAFSGNSGDTDSGMFSTADGLIQFYTQASEKLRITSEGKVGIGTTTPGFPLSFANAVGDKISLWGQSGNHYGIGIQGGLLQIHADSSGGDIAFGYGSSASMTEAMRIKGNGYVGIGTNAPTSMLTLRSASGSYGMIHTDGAVQVGTFVGGSTSGGWFGTASNHKLSLFVNNGGPSLTVDTTGNVGIGTTSPAAPLHVRKANPSVGAGTRKTGKDTSYGVYLGGNGGVSWPDGFSTGAGDNETIASGALSAVFNGDIIVSAHVWVGGALEYSDARAKNLLGTSDPVRDLHLLRNIKVRDFTWIDRTVDNHRPQKKLVAQEVEQVFPQAVQRVPQPTAIPNVYQVAEKVEFSPEQNELRLTTGKPHEFKVGDSVDLYTDDAPLTNVKVTAVHGEREFSIFSDHAPKSVFVYGKYVTDYRSVDYDAIAMLNVSATQELARQVDELKRSQARIAELEITAAKVTALEQKAARVESLEREVAELKRLVAGLAQAQMEPRPSPRNIAAASSH